MDRLGVEEVQEPVIALCAQPQGSNDAGHPEKVMADGNARERRQEPKKAPQPRTRCPQRLHPRPPPRPNPHACPLCCRSFMYHSNGTYMSHTKFARLEQRIQEIKRQTQK